MSLYTPPNNARFKRPPTAVEEFAAALESVKGGTVFHPEGQRQKTNMILSDIMDTADSNLEELSSNRRYKFLDDYLLSQVTPGMIRRIYESEGPSSPYVITPRDNANRLSDYNDVITYPASTLRDILGPISAP
jgi:hypothetical protein